MFNEIHQYAEKVTVTTVIPVVRIYTFVTFITQLHDACSILLNYYM